MREARRPAARAPAHESLLCFPVQGLRADVARLALRVVRARLRPFPPLWVRFLRVVGAALLVVLIQADWTQRKLRDYFLRPLARITNRVSPRGYTTYDWEE